MNVGPISKEAQAEDRHVLSSEAVEEGGAGARWAGDARGRPRGDGEPAGGCEGGRAELDLSFGGHSAGSPEWTPSCRSAVTTSLSTPVSTWLISDQTLGAVSLAFLHLQRHRGGYWRVMRAAHMPPGVL